MAIRYAVGKRRRRLPHCVLLRVIPRQLQRGVDGVVPASARVLRLPAVDSEGQVPVHDVAGEESGAGDLSGVHGGGAGGGVGEG